MFEVIKGEGADKLSKRFSREEIKGILTVPARKEVDFTQAPKKEDKDKTN